VGSNGGSELGGTTHREGRLAAALRPISMAWRRLPALELLHGVMGKVVEETGAQAWMRGKWGKKKGDGAAAGSFSSGSVAQGREGRWGGGPCGHDHVEEEEGRGGFCHGGRQHGMAGNGPWPSGVGDVVWAAGAWAQARCGTRCQRWGA
jgi:hypothetical protein